MLLSNSYTLIADQLDNKTIDPFTIHLSSPPSPLLTAADYRPANNNQFVRGQTLSGPPCLEIHAQN